MNRNIFNSGLMLLIMVGVKACASSPPATPVGQLGSSPLVSPTITESIPVTGHSMKPAESAPESWQLIYDVTSSGNVAPGGDTYELNLLERPFLKDMTYVPDLDIVSFNLSKDEAWYYISVELSGKDPNNSVGINYGVEIDLNFNGSGDYIIWVHPPYTPAWSTSTVQVLKDSNSDSAGLSNVASDGNGYDTLIFDGGASQNEDPDLAWVRIDGGPKATIQFAIKRSLPGDFFMLGVVSDAGLKDLSKFDYNDNFNNTKAGSPEHGNSDYPLKALYAVDNTCWTSSNDLVTTGYEPKHCQPIVQSNPTKSEDESGEDGSKPEATACTPYPQDCPTAPGYTYDYATCQCNYSTFP